MKVTLACLATATLLCGGGSTSGSSAPATPARGELLANPPAWSAATSARSRCS
jgi:hypothetical protein